MADEIEKKYRLNEAQKADVWESLEEIGAEFIGEDFEENILFSNDDLIEKQAVLRLRRVEIVLDILPFGDFMEIEGSLTAIAEAEMFLGAEDFEVVPETYPNLTLRFGKRNGDLIEARFG